ncbi:MAG: glycoside hydrolase family 5 protein [Actinomycetota bacterium]|nr:glycoside hydrolase family 5 protein [Actinomycetota bacterium]
MLRPRNASLRLLLQVALAAVFTLALPAVAQATPVSGVQAHLTWGGVDGAEMDRQLDRAKEAGAGLVRIDVGWSSLEWDGKGRYANWYLTKVDSAVEKANARGLKVLLTLMWSPPWASDSKARNAAPRNPQDYADTLAFLARRYGDRVTAWEVWNEPNQSEFWSAADPVGEYVALLEAAYPAAKQAAPGTTIIGGVTAESDHTFVEAMYQRGAKGNFDALSIHPYSGDNSPLDPNPSYTQLSFVAGVARVHDVMLRHGDDKPLWLTEFGWSNCTIRDQALWANCVDEAKGATYLEAAYKQMATWSYVPVGVWYTLKDLSTDLGNRDHNRGLLRADGSRKPAFAAFQRASAALKAGTVTAPAPETAPAPTPTPTPEPTTTPAPTKKKPGKRLGARSASVQVLQKKMSLRRSARSGRVRVACPPAVRRCRGSIVLSVKRRGRTVPVATRRVDVKGGAPTTVAVRFSSKTLAVVSQAGGVANVEVAGG